MFEDDERFSAVERARDREDLYESYMVELQKKVHVLVFVNTYKSASLAIHLHLYPPFFWSCSGLFCQLFCLFFTILGIYIMFDLSWFDWSA